MNQRNVILVGLGVLELLVATVALVMVDKGKSILVDYTCAAIMYAQPYLVAIWIAFGERTLPWRLVAVAVCLTCLSHCVDGFFIEAIAALGPGIAFVLGPLLLARTFGLRFYDASEAVAQDNPPRFQFSLRRMLEWTAAIAVLCSLAAIVSPELHKELHSVVTEEPLMLAVLHALLGGMSLVLVAIVLGMRRPWLGVALLVVPELFFAYVLYQMAGAEFPEMIVFVVSYPLWLALCLLPLRLFGYRYGRPPHPAAPPVADEEPGNCPLQEPSDSACEVAI